MMLSIKEVNTYYGGIHALRDVFLHIEKNEIVALIGSNGAGKSTLLSRISAAKPKIADYPFTTLTPNLGVVIRKDLSSFVVADIPGLIEGASQGSGLGLTFLRHVERTRLLIHLLDISQKTSPDPVKDFKTLNHELEAYHPLLKEKRQIVVINKIDLPLVKERASDFRKPFLEMGYSLHLISSKTGEGIESLMEAVADALESVLDRKHEQ